MLPGLIPALIKGVVVAAPLFPVVNGIAVSGDPAASTTHVIDLPSGIVAGELLIVFRHGSSGDSIPSGWTQSSGSSIGSFWKIASGSEGATVTVTGSASARGCAIAYRVGNHGSAVEFATASANDCPALSPTWGTTRNTLWFAYGGFFASGAITVSAVPANYSNGQFFNSGAASAASLGSGERQLKAATEDPGAFTVAGGPTGIRVWTCAVKGTT
jgi:hypothetical protein